jgi:hypothetical protein
MGEVNETADGNEYIEREWIESPKGWGKKLHGKLIIFPHGKDEISWGIEVSIPIDDAVRAVLRKSGIVVPKKITTFKYLDCAPQESLPKAKRNIRSDEDQSITLTPLNSLVNITDVTPFLPFVSPRSRPHRTIRTIMSTLLLNKESVAKFNDILEKSKGNQVLMVYGHGRDDLFHSGEQYFDTPDTKGAVKQTEGNLVFASEVVEKYNDPSKYAVIMFRSCYLGKDGIKQDKIPIVYVQGTVANNPIGRFWGDIVYGKARTVILMPDDEKRVNI